MKIESTIKELRRIMIDNHRCFGCGHEHRCGTRGCAIMRNAADTLEAQQGRIAELEAELKEERYRHDRLQDFEVAEAQVLAKLREERRWIPVGERLPTPYVDVITCRMGLLGRGCATGIECITIQREDALVWGKDLATWKSTVTHWMPLPEPPKEVG
ncbi:MAG: DUF551 domain-containing protein [Oscillospiraceae bacterium]|nr:DUF551 domain-containing protein [Oscillospiraceae bacterium]